MASREPIRRPGADSVERAASSDNTLQGYAAVNALTEQEEIARLAYQYYQQRAGEPGSAEEDWLKAEQELRGRRDSDAAGESEPTSSPQTSHKVGLRSSALKNDDGAAEENPTIGRAKPVAGAFGSSTKRHA